MQKFSLDPLPAVVLNDVIIPPNYFHPRPLSQPKCKPFDLSRTSVTTRSTSGLCSRAAPIHESSVRLRGGREMEPLHRTDLRDTVRESDGILQRLSTLYDQLDTAPQPQRRSQRDLQDGWMQSELQRGDVQALVREICLRVNQLRFHLTGQRCNCVDDRSPRVVREISRAVSKNEPQHSRSLKEKEEASRRKFHREGFLKGLQSSGVKFCYPVTMVTSSTHVWRTPNEGIGHRMGRGSQWWGQGARGPEERASTAGGYRESNSSKYPGSCVNQPESSRGLFRPSCSHHFGVPANSMVFSDQVVHCNCYPVCPHGHSYLVHPHHHCYRYYYWTHAAVPACESAKVPRCACKSSSSSSDNWECPRKASCPSICTLPTRRSWTVKPVPMTNYRSQVSCCENGKSAAGNGPPVLSRRDAATACCPKSTTCISSAKLPPARRQATSPSKSLQTLATTKSPSLPGPSVAVQHPSRVAVVSSSLPRSLIACAPTVCSRGFDPCCSPTASQADVGKSGVTKFQLHLKHQLVERSPSGTLTEHWCEFSDDVNVHPPGGAGLQTVKGTNGAGVPQGSKKISFVTDGKVLMEDEDVHEERHRKLGSPPPNPERSGSESVLYEG